MVNKNFNISRVEQNIEVIKKLKTDDSLLTMFEANRYSGFGGLREAIYTPSIYRQLKEYLSDDEIASIKATTGNAFYSPAIVVKFMWAVLERYLQVRGGDMLEPSAGIGVFLDNIPSSISFNSIDTLEIDLLTADILRIKHKNVNVICTGFERFYCGNKRYDLIISNPPYSRMKLHDVSQKDLRELCIHHYFIAKCARLLKLNIPCPRYTKKDIADDDVAAMAIDSTGLKRFGRDEWHQEKHKVSAKRSWCKLHVCVDDKHYIHGTVLTDRFCKR